MDLKQLYFGERKNRWGERLHPASATEGKSHLGELGCSLVEGAKGKPKPW